MAREQYNSRVDVMPKFQSPYDQHKQHNGKQCVVLGTVDPTTYDHADAGILFRVQLDGGSVIEAWPEEIQDDA